MLGKQANGRASENVSGRGFDKILASAARKSDPFCGLALARVGTATVPVAVRRQGAGGESGGESSAPTIHFGNSTKELVKAEGAL